MIRLHILLNNVETNFIDFPSQADVDNYLANIGEHWGPADQVSYTQEDITAQLQAAADKQAALEYLASTDWKILRHLRQKALNETPSLTDEQYLALEQSRSDAAKRVN